MSNADTPTAAFFRSIAQFAARMLFVLAAIYGLVYAASALGVERSVWDCEGTYVASAESGAEQWPEKATIQLERYRPFLVWADSDGNAQVEFHNVGTNYFEDLEIAGNAVRIGTSGRPNAGSFSLLSGKLNLSPGTGLGWFEGECEKRRD